MAVVIYILIFTSGVAIFLVSYIIIHSCFRKLAIKKKLSKDSIKEEKSQQVFGIISVFFRPLKTAITAITPKNLKNNIERSIQISNMKCEVGDLLLYKCMLGSFLLLLSIPLVGTFERGAIRILLPLILFYGAYITPDIILKNKAALRGRKIIESLPTFIDYLIICLEAGLGLDISIKKVIGKMQGPLAEEMAKAMTQIKYGKSRRDVFKQLVERLNIPELASLINSLIHAEQTGISLTNILSIQSKQIRESRKQRVQEEANKVAVKLIIPLVVFILPGVFIILLGPMMIKGFKF